jgi:hypothetical protein
VQFLITSNIPFSSLVMVAIAVDRYICICHPLRQVTLTSARRARFVVALLAAVATALGLCAALMFSVYHRVEVPFGFSSSPTGDVIHLTTEATTGHSFRLDERSFERQLHRVDRPVDGPPIGGGDGDAFGFAVSAGGTEVPPRDSDIETIVMDGAAPLRGQFSSSSDDAGDSDDDEAPILNTKYCGTSDLVLGAAFDFFDRYYVSLHSATFAVCLSTVVVLYSLIYRSVLIRRARRQRLRCRATPRAVSVTIDSNGEHLLPGWLRASASTIGLRTLTSLRSLSGRGSRNGAPQHVVVIDASADVSPTPSPPAAVGELPADALQQWLSPSVRNGAADYSALESTKAGGETAASPETAAASAQGVATVTQSAPRRQSPTQRGSASCIGGCLEHHRTLLAANLRTAAMLFVVTVVFVLSYTPAFLMSLELVPYRKTIFYLYFANSIANPFVYSFMNRYFRQELRTIVCRPIRGYQQ